MASNQDFLSPQQMQGFIGSLGDLTPDEVRKAKSLYLRNALSEYQALKSSYASFGTLQIFFAIIPCFWPFLLVQRATMNSATQLYHDRIRNALEVWKDDLGAEADEFRRQLAQL